jgi:hypothetical protein
MKIKISTARIRGAMLDISPDKVVEISDKTTRIEFSDNETIVFVRTTNEDPEDNEIEPETSSKDEEGANS